MLLGLRFMIVMNCSGNQTLTIEEFDVNIIVDRRQDCYGMAKKGRLDCGGISP